MRRFFASRSGPKSGNSRPLSRQQESQTASISQIPTNSDNANRERWHLAIEGSHEISEFLINGSPSITFDHLEALKRPTINYLATLPFPSAQDPSGSDGFLSALIEESWRRPGPASELAILACLHALSVPAAVWHIRSLEDGEVGRYVRYISLAGYAHPYATSKEESKCARILVQILNGEGLAFTKFQQLVENLSTGWSPTFLLPAIVQNVLTQSKISSRLQQFLDVHLAQRRFKTLFLSICWLYDVPKIPLNMEITYLLDKYFSAWIMLLAWRPCLDRIRNWELNSWKDTDKKKLSHFFDLDGPDTATGKRSSLLWAEPHCYKHVGVRLKTAADLERILSLLCQAQESGDGAIGLFIYLCVDNAADNPAVELLESMIQAGNDQRCATMITVLRALQPTQAEASNLQQMRHLTKALPVLDDRSLRDITDLKIPALVNRLTITMKAAQEAFCKQLETGTGENLGMQIFDFGEAIRCSSWIHPHLESGALAEIGQFPSRDIVGALFDQLEMHARSSSHGDSRFKSYLAASIGGRELNDMSVTLEAIQSEIRFWKRPPDVDQKGLAIALTQIKSLDYSLYTSCLEVMLKEDRSFILGLKNRMRLGREVAFHQIAEYLVQRRSLQQRSHECWRLLLASIIKENGDNFLLKTAVRTPFEKWTEIISVLISSIAPIQAQLPLAGAGLTQQLMNWWAVLAQYNTAVCFLNHIQGPKGNLAWLYFLGPDINIISFLDITAQGQKMSQFQSQIVSCLAVDGKNVVAVRDCLEAVERASTVIGRAVCERILSRRASNWMPSQLTVITEGWRKSSLLAPTRNRLALEAIVRVLRLPSSDELRTIQTRPVGERLLSEYTEMLEKAKNLERQRLRLRHRYPEQTSSLLQQLGIENSTTGRLTSADLTEELLDQVEVVGDSEYELSFPLLGLHDLQRRSRRISRRSRMIFVRIHLQDPPQFCLHTYPDERSRNGHSYWRGGGTQKPNTPICRTVLTPFIYYLNRNIHDLLQGDKQSLISIFLTISKLVTESPERCISCCTPLGVKTWTPSTCSDHCSLELGTAPLEIRLHNFLVDELAMDLLLSCTYMAAADTTDKELLPGCPVKKARIRAVIDSIPDLDSLRHAIDVRKAIHGNDGLGQDRENLLSWLCTKFRGFMMKAPSDYKIPSMGENTKQLLMLNSHPERERLFCAQLDSQQGSGVVFHGTQPSRMFLVLTEGLKAMTNTAFMLHGAAGGEGVYCGDKLETSLPYAGTIGECWSKSKLGNMRIMLGCELSGYASPPAGPLANAHVIRDENRLLIRYIFLLPVGFQPPPRHHVAQAMMSVFPRLRSDLV